MTNKTKKHITSVLSIFLALVFIGVFGGPQLLKLYIRSGMGDCKSLPITCREPEIELNDPAISKEAIENFVPYVFKEIEICLPKSFNVVKSHTKKYYFKRRMIPTGRQTIYLLYKEPNFFVNLFPHLKKKGVKDDYEFIRRTMYAKTTDIHGITDTFFVIMKGVFTPFLGDQQNLAMIKFKLDDKRGFINFDLSQNANYFDCNIIDGDNNFFKVYIKDTSCRLELADVFAILSTVKKPVLRSGLKYLDFKDDLR